MKKKILSYQATFGGPNFFKRCVNMKILQCIILSLSIAPWWMILSNNMYFMISPSRLDTHGKVIRIFNRKTRYSIGYKIFFFQMLSKLHSCLPKIWASCSYSVVATAYSKEAWIGAVHRDSVFTDSVNKISGFILPNLSHLKFRYLV